MKNLKIQNFNTFSFSSTFFSATNWILVSFALRALDLIPAYINYVVVFLTLDVIYFLFYLIFYLWANICRLRNLSRSYQVCRLIGQMGM